MCLSSSTLGRYRWRGTYLDIADASVPKYLLDEEELVTYIEMSQRTNCDSDNDIYNGLFAFGGTQVF